MKKLKGSKFKEFFQRIWKVINLPEMGLLPGQLAFFLVLAIIPTLTLVSYGASILNLSIDFIYDFLQKAFSPEIAQLILGTSDIFYAGLKLTIVIIMCYYLASNGANSVIVTSNTIYGIKNGNWFKRRLKAIVMSILFVLLIVFILVIPLFGDMIINLIQSVNLNQGVTDAIVRVYDYLRSPVMWILLFLMIKIIYIIAPDREITSHNTTYGAIFTTVTWILTTFIYSFYINNIANYSTIYGNLTNICVIMIWLYFISYFFVLGMSLNFQRESEKDEILIQED